VSESIGPPVQARFVVKGRVQGVGFRAFVAARARESGLSGWVRNLSDGRTVELVAAGDQSGLDRLEAMLRRGPPGSIVESVARYPADTANDAVTPHTSFEIRR